MKNVERMRVAAVMAITLCATLALSATAAEFKRELSTDRPDKTESPYTVERGRFQFEVNAMEFSYYNNNITDSTQLRLRHLDFGVNAKFGLMDNVDLQLMIGYEGTSQWVESESLRESKFPKIGFADPGLRVKINLTGNDSGKYAVAMMPYVLAPFGSDPNTSDAWQAGLILPCALELGDRAGLGFMNQVDLIADDSGDRHHFEYVASVTSAFDLSRRLGIYFELFQSVAISENQTWIPTFDSGLTYEVNENVQLDLGMNLGLNGHADNFNPFVGFSLRL